MSNMIQVSGDAMKSIALHGDYSKVSEGDRVNIALNLCETFGLNPATVPFNWLKNEKTGAISLYPNKSCAAGLASNRNLSVEVVKEGPVMDTAYSVTVRVKEGDRVTEDVGVTSITYFKKGDASTPGSWTRIEGSGLADAIMKAHTKATRRTVLKHCGLSLPEEKEGEEPIIIVDTPVKVTETPKEVAKQIVQAAEVKHDEAKANGYTPEAKEQPKEEGESWIGRVEKIVTLEKPKSKAPVWEVIGQDGSSFKTDDVKFQDVISSVEHGESVAIRYKVSGKGTKVIQSMVNA